MITNDQVPAWLADLGDKLKDKTKQRFERENIRQTMVVIRDFVTQHLEAYERGKL